MQSADVCTHKDKIKTSFAKLFVSGTPDRPYFNILYFDPVDQDYHIGFSSYCLEYVFKWLSEEFEIEDAPAADVAPVTRCKDCKYLRVWNQKDLYAFCPKTNFVFLPFQADTRTHFCSLGEPKET